MDKERSKEEIVRHRHPALPDAEKYRVVKCEYAEDFETNRCELVLTVKHSDTCELKVLKFNNVGFNEPVFTSIRDVTGLYLMDTSHLGWSSQQQIEVGDWDGDPPIYWAESVQIENL